MPSIKHYLVRLKSSLRKLSEGQFLLGLVVWDFASKFLRIWSPGEPYFDERPYYIKAARDYLEGVFTTNPEHPPLAKLIMAAGIKTLGDDPFGWRLPSVILGTAGVVATYFLAKRLTGSKKVAALASVLLSFEFGWFVSSRVATLEIYVASFLLLGSFFAFRLYQEGKFRDLLLAGIFLGAAFASKWSAVLLIGWLGLFLVTFWKKRFVVKVGTALLIGLLTLAVYFTSYLPYLSKNSLSELVELHKWMISYHTNIIPEVQRKIVESRHYQFHPFPAWSWFLDPPFYYYGKTFGREFSQAIVFFFNPLVLWGGLAGFVLMTKEQLGKLKPETVFLLGAFLAQYLPWFLSPRYTLTYYLLGAMPFFCIAFSLFLRRIWQRDRTWFYALVLASVCAFLIYYPLLTALKVPYLYSRIITGVVEFRELLTS